MLSLKINCARKYNINAIAFFIQVELAISAYTKVKQVMTNNEISAITLTASIVAIHKNKVIHSNCFGIDVQDLGAKAVLRYVLL